MRLRQFRDLLMRVRNVKIVMLLCLASLMGRALGMHTHITEEERISLGLPRMEDIGRPPEEEESDLPPSYLPPKLEEAQQLLPSREEEAGYSSYKGTSSAKQLIDIKTDDEFKQLSKNTGVSVSELKKLQNTQLQKKAAEEKAATASTEQKKTSSLRSSASNALETFKAKVGIQTKFEKTFNKNIKLYKERYSPIDIKNVTNYASQAKKKYPDLTDASIKAVMGDVLYKKKTYPDNELYKDENMKKTIDDMLKARAIKDSAEKKRIELVNKLGLTQEDELNFGRVRAIEMRKADSQKDIDNYQEKIKEKNVAISATNDQEEKDVLQKQLTILENGLNQAKITQKNMATEYAKILPTINLDKYNQYYDIKEEPKAQTSTGVFSVE